MDISYFGLLRIMIRPLGVVKQKVRFIVCGINDLCNFSGGFCMVTGNMRIANAI